MNNECGTYIDISAIFTVIMVGIILSFFTTFIEIIISISPLLFILI